MANSLNLYEVHSFSTSLNSCQSTIVLNADFPNCPVICISNSAEGAAWVNYFVV